MSSEASLPIALAMVMAKDFTLPFDQSEPELIGSFQTLTAGKFPFILPEMIVYLQLTDGEGTMQGQIQCLDSSGRVVFGTPVRSIRLRPSIEVTQVMFRSKTAAFPVPADIGYSSFVRAGSLRSADWSWSQRKGRSTCRHPESDFELPHQVRCK